MERAKGQDGDIFMVRARRCQRCGGLLTSAQAVADGYGHVCKMKELQKKRDREERKNQYSLFEEGENDG